MSLHIEVIANTQTHKIIKINSQSGRDSQDAILQAIAILTNNHTPLNHDVFDCSDNPSHKLVVIYK